jgi:phosphatidylethanolamine/phosphatidyl-N-methylethanolamine N-methyltransferase
VLSIEGKTRAPDRAHMRKAYARWAPIYDLAYRRFTAPGREEAVRIASACGPDILEVGVGTGLSLKEYPKGSRVVGIDLSRDMLRRAVKKVARDGLRHVRGLAVMDACRLGFPDAAFNAVVAQYVITLVPDPEAALNEFLRVLKPGGEIILVSHFGAVRGTRAAIEEAVAPIAGKIGWSADFKVGRVDAWARSTAMMRLASVKPMPPAGFFSVLRLTRTP